MSRKRNIDPNKTIKNKRAKEEVIEKTPFWQKIVPPFVLTFFTWLFYYPSLNYPFQFDDLANITKNFGIRNYSPWLYWFNRSRWMGDFLNRINYMMGRFDPFYYRFFNVIIHTLAGIFLYYLILELCNFLKKDSFLYKNSRLISFITAALFLLHPVQTQTVSYVIQGRLEGLASMLVIMSLFFLVKTFSIKNIPLKILSFAFGTFVAAFSAGAKEIVIVVPVLFLLIDWFFVSQGEWKNFKKRIWYYVGFCGVFLFFLLNFIQFDFIKRALSLNMTTANNRGNILTENAFDIITPYQFLISEFKVIIHYLVMFLWPSIMCVEYDWKLSKGFFAPDAFFPFLALMGILVIAIYASMKKKYNFLSFGLLWFLVSVAPRTTIIPSPELLCDYKTYLASVGWLFIFAVSLVYLMDFIVEKISDIPKSLFKFGYQFSLFIIFMIPLGLGTVYRNTVWSTASNFWEDIVKKAPLKARGHNNWGVALSEDGKVDEAIEQYKIAIRLDRNYADPWSNIAVAYSLKGEIEQAINALRGAIAIFPDYAEAYNNLGSLLLNKKDYVQAENCLDKAIQLRSYYGKAFYNKGRLYLEQGKDEEAWQYFKKATEGDLDTPEGFYTLGQISIQLQKYEEAVNAFEKILKLGVSNPSIEFNLANAYFMTKDIPRSRAMYQRLVDNFPLEGKYLYNLAETYFSENDFSTAASLFQKVLTLPNALGQAYFRIAACLEKSEQQDKAVEYLSKILDMNAPDNFKQTAREEIARIELAQKVKDGNGSVRMSEISKILRKAAPPEMAQAEMERKEA